MTTTGITASMPMTLTLIEAIAGREKAEAVARDLGLDHWDARHASDQFKLTRPFALTVMGNVVAIWNREKLGLEVAPGIDEVSLALVADAWSRTYRSRAITFAASPGAIATRNGIRIVPDQVGGDRRRRMSSTHSGIGRQPTRWTKCLPASRLATARARATSSPCSWNIHG